MTDGPTKDLVIQLREIRDELGLSINDIMDMLEKQGTPLSESTVRRVFDHDINMISGFSYDATLMPVCDLLLPKGDTKVSSLSEARIESLIAIIEIKNEMIADRDRTIQTIMRQFDEAEEKQKTRCEKCEDNVAFMKEQIKLKDERMDKKDEWIDRLLGHIEEMLHTKE